MTQIVEILFASFNKNSVVRMFSVYTAFVNIGDTKEERNVEAKYRPTDNKRTF